MGLFNGVSRELRTDARWWSDVGRSALAKGSRLINATTAEASASTPQSTQDSAIVRNPQTQNSSNWFYDTLDTARDLGSYLWDGFRNTSLGRAIFGLLDSAEAAEQAITIAERTAAAAPTTTARDQANAVAARTARETLKQAAVSLNGGDKSKVSATLTAIDNMDDATAIARAKELISRLKEAGRTKNEALYKAAERDLVEFMDSLSKRVSVPSDGLKTAAGDALGTYTAAAIVFVGTRRSDTRTIQRSERTSANGISLQGIGTSVDNTNTAAVSLKRSGAALGLPQKVVSSMDDVITQNRELAGLIIQVADEKGYNLDNYTALALIAAGADSNVLAGTSGGNAEELLTSDIRLPGRISLISNTLARDVMEMLLANRERNAELDTASADKVARNKVDEMEWQKRVQARVEQLRTLVENMTDEKLKVKLLADIMVLSRCLQNPTKGNMIEALRILDDLQKIKYREIAHINN